MPQDCRGCISYPAGILLVLIGCFLIFSGTSDDAAPSYGDPRGTALDEELRAIRLVNHSHYGDFEPQDGRWMNISGFTNDTGFAWSGLARARTLAQSLRSYALEQQNDTLDPHAMSTSSLYKNISGSVDGHWTIPWVSRPVAPRVKTAKANGNLTGPAGEVSISIEEYEIDDQDAAPIPGELSWIRATFTVDDPNSKGSPWKSRLNGVHVKTDGSLILVSTSHKLAGIFALPQLVPIPQHFDPVKRFIAQQVNDTITAQIESREWIANPWSARLGGGPDTDEHDLAPQCELIAYMQQHSSYEAVSGSSQSPAAEVEAELREPTGRVLKQPKDMTFSLVAFSPDCGYIFESTGPPAGGLSEGNHLRGPKTEVDLFRLRNHVLVFTVILLCQLRLLMLQMAEASTPSVLSRLSAPTFVLIFLGDNGGSMMLGAYSLVNPGPGMTLLAALFISFLCSTFFDLRLVLNILATQASAGRPRDTTRPADGPPAATPAPSPPRPPEQSVEPGTLPLPATARRSTDSGASPVVLPTDQDEPATATIAGTTIRRTASTAGSVHAILLALNFVLMFTTVSTFSWRSSLQRPYFLCLSFGLTSIWTPQIYLNAVRNCRKALRWDFVVGQSILRLIPLAYFYVYRYNIFWTRQHWWTMYILTGWVWAQVVVLASQNLFGPRWFLKDDWLPPAYDYHPVLFEDAEGEGLPIGAKEAKVGAAKGVKEYECVICMQDVEVRTVTAEEGAEGGLAKGAEAMLARRAYMVTPCRHIFHSKCLEAWLRLRLQCPMCRELVPAV